MTAATTPRNTPALAEEGAGYAHAPRYRGVKGGAKIIQGTIGVLNAGYLAMGTLATGLVAEGRLEDNADNTAGADGAMSANVKPGCYKWANSAASDAITVADIGKPCFIVDNQTVARLSATEARSPAGIVSAVASDGVWVTMSREISLLIQTRLDTLVVP